MARGHLVSVAKAQERRLLLERQQGSLCELRRLRCGQARPGAQAMTRFPEEHLKYLATWARTSRQFFDGHDMRADEVNDRQMLEKIEFLLAEIERLRAALKDIAGDDYLPDGIRAIE